MARTTLMNYETRPTRNFHIPQELTDMIMDFLHDNLQSLMACALVARSWLPTSRLHLFWSCTIEDSRRFDFAFRTITTTPWDSVVGIYIRQLMIVGEQLHGFNFGMFKTLLRGLPHLRSLYLKKVEFQTQGPRASPQGARPGYRDTTKGRYHLLASGFPQDTSRQREPFALEELHLLECDATMCNYAHLFRILGLFSTIKTLFLVSSSVARCTYSERRLPGWALKQVRVAVQHLHTFDIPFPIIEILLNTLGATNTLRTFRYDDNVLDWHGGPSTELEKFSKMAASLPLHQQLRCLILGPLPIFETSYGVVSSLFFGITHGMERSLTHLQLALASIHGLRAFHLCGRWLEPRMADIFAALPESIREARFIVVDVSKTYGDGSLNQFRGFAQAFGGELARRTTMTFVLDLGIAKTVLEESTFVQLRDRAEEGLSQLASPGHLLIDESPKELSVTVGQGLGNQRRRQRCGCGAPLMTSLDG